MNDWGNPWSCKIFKLKHNPSFFEHPADYFFFNISRLLESSYLCFSSFFSQAVDVDLFSNITYRIKTESARQLFSLNPITGELAVLQTLDFEGLAAIGMGASYTFQVEAVDQGARMPPGQATVTVRITVRAQRLPVQRLLSVLCSLYLLLSLHLHCCSGDVALISNYAVSH